MILSPCSRWSICIHDTGLISVLTHRASWMISCSRCPAYFIVPSLHLQSLKISISRIDTFSFSEVKKKDRDTVKTPTEEKVLFIKEICLQSVIGCHVSTLEMVGTPRAIRSAGIHEHKEFRACFCWLDSKLLSSFCSSENPEKIATFP